ncbi:hypothetical protein GUJ93_ZPchr0007g5284 [Zizania palustris]|uniref:Uncharacterized protein n=1 Tax=Zizania palustris TaxID=103762 RepID=A0A8J5TDX6_ZIZPA|nr:hypothetical protein GUJ93_ZPchr0007g5284 [Zizania palustris]
MQVAEARLAAGLWRRGPTARRGDGLQRRGPYAGCRGAARLRQRVDGLRRAVLAPALRDPRPRPHAFSLPSSASRAVANVRRSPPRWPRRSRVTLSCASVDVPKLECASSARKEKAIRKEPEDEGEGGRSTFK